MADRHLVAPLEALEGLDTQLSSHTPGFDGVEVGGEDGEVSRRGCRRAVSQGCEEGEAAAGGLLDEVVVVLAEDVAERDQQVAVFSLYGYGVLGEGGARGDSRRPGDCWEHRSRPVVVNQGLPGGPVDGSRVVEAVGVKPRLEDEGRC